MKTILLVNATVNSGSTGRIAEEISQAAIANGYQTYFGYGRIGRDSKSQLIKIGSDKDVMLHGLGSLLFDNHGFCSKTATRKFIDEIEKFHPSVINLHNIHGYYLNVEILFNYLEISNIPVVWTLHDCWPFTGHCTYFDRYNCLKWQSCCERCPNSKGYPKSLCLDRSKSNYKHKKELFNKPNNITFVSPCHWMERLVRQSFLSKYPVVTIHNGVDIDVFKSMESTEIRKELGIAPDKKIILGVASTWDRRKGFDDFVTLSQQLDNNHQIVLVGLNDKQEASLPKNMIGIKRTENIQQLAELYSLANVFVNPTYVDNFPTTNIEALACGTPVVTYRTGGSPEAIDSYTGVVVNKGDINLLKLAVEFVANRKAEYTTACRKRAEVMFNKHDRFNDYIALFNNLIDTK